MTEVNRVVDPAARSSEELIDLHTHILDLLVAEAPQRDVLGAIAMTIDRLMPGASCAVLLLDKAHNVLRFGAGPKLPAEWSHFIDPLRVGPEVGSCGAAAFHRRRVICADICADPRWDDFRDVALRLGIRACWSTPIIGRQREVLGTFAVYHDRAHKPSEHELRVIDRCTHLAAIAIDHARLFGALAESEDRFRRAFESNAVGMALLDLSGRFVRVNPGLCDMLSCTERSLHQAEYAQVVEEAQAGITAEAIARLAAGELESVHLEQNYRRQDGSSLPVSFTASALRGADGSAVGICAYVLDLSHRHAAEQQSLRAIEAEVARRSAESASRAKSQFLSVMSHELRTPLTALLGFAELLETLEAERRGTAIERIREAASHVVSILDDVLDIAKVEASALAMDVEAVSVDYLVRDALDLVGPMAAQHGITLAMTAGTRPVVVHADSRRVRQILLNLLTNAIKYNGDGGEVHVDVKRRRRDALIRVTDTGIGIDHDLLCRLFVPFDRLGAERSGIPGSGLGLSLSRGLARAMKGDLTVASSAGVGTTVELKLPLAQRVAEHNGAGQPTEGATLAVRKDVQGIVLHVEDDSACRDLVAEAFRRRPAVHLVTCINGRDGLTTARKLQPDLILLDLDLPDMTGEQFVAELAHPGFVAPPSITILSGRAATAPVSLPSFRKPVAIAKLLQHIDERLGSTPAS